MGWWSARWKHECGGSAVPGDACDWCGAKLKASVDEYDHPKSWVPPGGVAERKSGEAFSIW